MDHNIWLYDPNTEGQSMKLIHLVMLMGLSWRSMTGEWYIQVKYANDI